MISPNFKETTQRKTVHGRLLSGLGIIMVFCFFLFIIIMIITEKTIGENWSFLFIVTPFFSAFLIQYGKRLSTKDPASILLEDKRPVVLILRAFTVDKTAFWDGTGSELNFEQNLTSILGYAGPVVAVGRPGEDLAPSGAARLYIPNESWKSKVLQLMDEAKIVVLILFSENQAVETDKLEGFQWEIQEAVNRLAPQKLLFVLPASTRLVNSVASYSFHNRKKNRITRQKSFDDFTRLIKSAFPNTLPLSFDKAQFLYFNSDGEPKTSRSRANGLIGFSLALRPFFKVLGIKPPSVNPLLLLWKFNILYRSTFLAFIFMIIILIICGSYINLFTQTL